MVFSLEQVLIDVEIFRMCAFARHGMTVRDDLWLDEVIRARARAASSSARRSTRGNVRGGEWFLPGLGVHETLEAWEADGRPIVLDEARRRAEEILAGQQALPLGDDVERELHGLYRRAATEDAACRRQARAGPP